MKLYTINDRVVGTFGQVLTYPNDETAIRAFRIYSQNNPDIKNDLVLYKLGSYDNETAKIEVLESPISLISGVDCVEAKEK